MIRQPNMTFLWGVQGLLLAFLSLALTACVTVNIYFPAAAAQKLADQVVDQVYKAAQKGQVTVQVPPSAPTASPSPKPSPLAPSAWHPNAGQALGFLSNTVFSLISSPAQAAANLNASSPGVIAAKQQVESLAQQLGSYFAQGAIGYTANGLVAIHDANSVGLAERAQLPGLVDSYNQALQNLYTQIADANGHPEWAPQIQQSFARAWINKAPAGYWYQDNSGQWVRK